MDMQQHHPWGMLLLLGVRCATADGCPPHLYTCSATWAVRAAKKKLPNRDSCSPIL